MRYALGELAALPRAAVVVEDRYSQIYKQDRVRPALVADGIAECQVRWPNIPIVFCENRSLAEEWTYRYLAAAHAWATTDRPLPNASASGQHCGRFPNPRRGPSPAEIRDWARRNGHRRPRPRTDPGLHPPAWERSTRPTDP